MNLRPTRMIDEMVGVLRSEYDIDAMCSSRKESVVIPRAALFNVCRGYYYATALAKYFGKNHATILHHFKNHDALMYVPQYREIHNRLLEVLRDYDESARAKRMIERSEMEALRIENEELKTKLMQYEEVDS